MAVVIARDRDRGERAGAGLCGEEQWRCEACGLGCAGDTRASATADVRTKDRPCDRGGLGPPSVSPRSACAAKLCPMHSTSGFMPRLSTRATWLMPRTSSAVLFPCKRRK